MLGTCSVYECSVLACETRLFFIFHQLEEFKDINRAQLKPVSVTEEDQSYMDKLMNDRCHRIQEMEASNR